MVVAAGPAVAQQGLPAQAVGMLQVGDVAPRVKSQAHASIAGPDGQGKDGPMAKVGMELALLYHQAQAAGASGVRSLRAATPRPKAAAPSTDRRRPRNRVLSPLTPDGEAVYINAIAAEDPARLQTELRALGLTKDATAGAVVSGRFPIAELRAAAQLSALRGMIPAYAQIHVGSVDSEADTSHATVQVRETTGLDGSGQKICALSDSYDQSDVASTTAADDVASGDLPGVDNPLGNTAPVDVVEDGAAGNTDEGRAMLQLIHDIAPGATLGFHTAFGGIGVFAQGIRDLANADCTVIVDDVGYNIEPFYQDGPVSNAVDDVVTNRGVPYFSSAGNDGQNSYEAPFRDSGEPGVISGTSVAHDFDPSGATDTRQEIALEAGGNFRIFAFQWTDPSSLVSGSEGAKTDIDVALIDEAGTIVAESSSNNIQSGVPVESIDYTNETGSAQTLDLVIEKFDGPDPEEIKYVYSGSDYAIQEYDTLGPTVYGHPMAEGAMAVAAAPFFNTAAYNPNVSSATLESFSSKGGIPLLFDQSGKPLPNPVVRQKPEVTGTDGIDNTFFGTDISDTALDGLDSDPHPNFFGTSAAAPNVAAIATLIRQARPGLLPAGIYDRLQSTAADVVSRQTRDGEFVSIPEGEGVDPWSGHGFVQGPEAVPEPIVADLQATASNPTDGAVTLNWTPSPTANIESYEVQRRYFNGAFTPVKDVSGPPVTLDSLGLGVFAFRVRWTRADGTQGTSAAVSTTFNVQDLSLNLGAEDESGRRSVDLSWSVPVGTEGFTYRVERRAGATGSFEVVDEPSQTSYTAPRQLPGTYTYRIVSVNGEGNTLSSPPEEVTVEFGGEVATVGPYPNPAQEYAQFDLTARASQPVTVEVFNTIGEQVYTERRQLQAQAPTTLRFDTSMWSSGVYFLRVQGEDFSKTRRFAVVQ